MFLFFPFLPNTQRQWKFMHLTPLELEYELLNEDLYMYYTKYDIRNGRTKNLYIKCY